MPFAAARCQCLIYSSTAPLAIPLVLEEIAPAWDDEYLIQQAAAAAKASRLLVAERAYISGLSFEVYPPRYRHFRCHAILPSQKSALLRTKDLFLLG